MMKKMWAEEKNISFIMTEQKQQQWEYFVYLKFHNPGQISLRKYYYNNFLS